ncbi:MAG: hypothetical protein F6J96_14145 [Symploca sp. SIO1C2]|nr:hypothetical protein [Symploca sp. SIO1C2]
MKKWQIVRKGRQWLTLMLATVMWMSVAVSPAQASGQLSTISHPSSGVQIALAEESPKKTPTLLSSFDTPGEAYGVAISGNTAYVADLDSGLQIIDVKDPTAPKILGSIDTHRALRLAIADNKAYIADWTSGLQIIDVSNVEAPQLLGSFDTPDYAHEVAISDNKAYVADYGSGVQIIDVKDPADPKHLSSFNTPGSALGVLLVGNTAYVADGKSGLQILDVSHPNAPTLLGSFDTPGVAYKVAIADNIAYVADEEYGLQIIDVSNSEAPKLLGSFDTPGIALGVTIAGNRVYVADGYSGLQIIDVTNPNAPTLLSNVDTPGYALGVVIADNKVYITDLSGLHIINVDEEKTVNYGTSYHLENQWPFVLTYLDACGDTYCVPTTQLSVFADAELDQAGVGTGTWKFESATGASAGTPVSFGDLVYLQNKSSQSYLDICGLAACTSTPKFSVVTDVKPDRDGEGTGVWKIESTTGASAGTPVSVDDLIYLKNQWSVGQTYLNVDRLVTCGSRTKLSVVTDPEPNQAGVGTGTWKIVD